jgi:predicted alpha/beta superfamily hydrolase
MRLRLIAALALLLINACAFAQMKVVSEGKAIQVRTDELIVHSERIGRDFLIEVTLLDQPQPGRRYAAVYAVDGGLGVAGPASRLMVAGRRTVPYYVVAIGYANAMGRHVGQRNTDLVHRRVRNDEGKMIGGGGGAFEAFILKDLRPYLERRYPLDPTRAVLLGHSGGGLFAATILVTNPDAFHAYVIGAPSLWYDSPLAQQAKAIAPRGNGKRVFIGYTPSDALNSLSDQFAAPLLASGSTFNARQEIFGDETHNSEYLQLIARGLPFVLPTETAELPAIVVKPDLLDRYVGQYRIDAQRVIMISRKGDKLAGSLNPRARFLLEAQTPTRFFSREANVILTFASPTAGKSPRLEALVNDQESTAERIE